MKKSQKPALAFGDGGDGVYALRQNLGLSRPSFAALVGVDLRTVIRWETGFSSPSGSAEGVITAFSNALSKNEKKVRTILVKASKVGGLAYLLMMLLEEAVAR